MNKDKLNSIKDKLTVFKYDTVDLNKSQKSNDLYDNIKQLDKQIAQLKNERYILNEEYVKTSFNDCQGNIQRCFKNNTSDNEETTRYYMIIKTREIKYEMRIGNSFDEHNYHVLTFQYPYDNSLSPFTNDIVNIHYEIRTGSILEIDKTEFLEKCNEVNKDWIKKINT